jgi:predicted RNA-binding protein with PUA-like domain
MIGHFSTVGSAWKREIAEAAGIAEIVTQRTPRRRERRASRLVSSRRAPGRAALRASVFIISAMNWLFKEEPSNYSYDDLVKDGRTSWTGVRNPLAQKHLRSVRRGDRVFYYHTGDEKAVVGIAKAAGDAYADPADRTGKLHAVDIAPVRKLKQPVTLAAIKADKAFAAFALTRIPRLSVMPVTEAEWTRIEDMAR